MAATSRLFSGAEKAHEKHDEEPDPREQLMFDPLAARSNEHDGDGIDDPPPGSSGW